MAELHIPPQALQNLDGQGLRIAIVHARWNKEIIEALVSCAVMRLGELGVSKSNIVLESVPGSWELPAATQLMLQAAVRQAASVTTTDDLMSLSEPQVNSADPKSVSSTAKFDAIIAIGVLIKGESSHYEHISASVSTALQNVAILAQTPVIFGVLTCLTEEQARARAGLVPGKSTNHGPGWAEAAVEMGCKAQAWAKGSL